MLMRKIKQFSISLQRNNDVMPNQPPATFWSTINRNEQIRGWAKYFKDLGTATPVDNAYYHKEVELDALIIENIDTTKGKFEPFTESGLFT